MFLEDYKVFCEDFFKQDKFKSNESLAKEIAHLSAEEFRDWQGKMFEAYNEKYNVVREIIRGIRIRSGFDVNAADVDWDADPVKQGDNRILVKSYQDLYNSTFEENIVKYKVYEQKCEELKKHVQNMQH